jgi:hypothetical protein
MRNWTQVYAPICRQMLGVDPLQIPQTLDLQLTNHNELQQYTDSASKISAKTEIIFSEMDRYFEPYRKMKKLPSGIALETKVLYFTENILASWIYELPAPN